MRSGSLGAGPRDVLTRFRFPWREDAPQDEPSGGDVLDVARAASYRFLLVLELAERGLSEAILHDHIAGEKLALVRSITTDLANALSHLHDNERIHADLKPLNAVRVASSWQLIDLDVCCTIEEAFGTKVPSSGYCPPEMAKVLLEATDTEGNVDTAKLCSYRASVAYDLWSFGVVLFHLVTGTPLWRTDNHDDVSSRALEKLATWTSRQAATEFGRAVLYPKAALPNPLGSVVPTTRQSAPQEQKADASANTLARSNVSTSGTCNNMTCYCAIA